MKTSSAKAKGRELCKLVKAALHTILPNTVKDEDIRVTPSGVNGEDLQFSPYIRKILPISIECKNHAKFAVYKDFEQAKTNAGKNWPVLIIKQNRSSPLAILDITFLLFLLEKVYGKDKETQSTKKKESNS